jgi:hypothetical protein
MAVGMRIVTRLPAWHAANTRSRGLVFEIDAWPDQEADITEMA